MVAIEQRTWDEQQGYSEWKQVKKVTLLEAVTFLNAAKADPQDVSHGVDIYVDPFHHEYRLIGLLH
jgi:hypothetical protein